MDQYLLQILKETNTIIIPDLGALTITNATTGEVMFMPFLKHDDGKLSSHIAEKEGIEDNEAKNIVAKHVREIKTSLDKGDSYDMFEFGTFTKGKDGDIEFENWDGGKKAAPVVETPKAEAPKKAEKPKEEKKEKVKEEKPKTVAKPEPEPEPVEKKAPAKKVEPKAEDKPKAAPKVEKPKEEGAKATDGKSKDDLAKKTEKPKAATPPPVKKEEPVKEKKVAPVVPVTPPAPKKEMNIVEKKEKAKTQDKLDKLKKNKEDDKKKKKRGVGFYMLIIFVVLIAAGGTYFVIDYDNLKQHIPFLADAKEKEKDPKELEKMKEAVGDDEQEDEIDPVDDQEDENIDEVDPEEQETEPEVVETPDPEPVRVSNGSNDQPFHIVAGAFGDPANADRLVEKIKAMGYPAKTISRGAQTIVSVQSYSTKAEAKAAISSVQDAAPKGWVLEWRD